MADINIDGKKYDASDMNEEQLPIAQKLTQLVNTENNLKSQLLDIGILKDAYINKFKDITDKE